jgi:V/A-type H+-transporting ATPase subunit E
MAQIETKGVQELIDQLRTEGVEKAKEEAILIKTNAETEAKKILEKANADAKALLEKAHTQRESEKTAFEASMKTGARDVVLRLKNEITEIFKLEILSSVKSTMNAEEFIEKLVIELGKKAVESGQSGAALSIELPLSKEDEKQLQEEILVRLKDKIAKGVTIGTGTSQGIKLIFNESGCQVELNNEIVAAMMGERLIPGFRKLLEGLN